MPFALLTRALAALAMPALLALPSCKRAEPEPQPTATAPEEMTLGAAIATQPELSSLSRALEAADFTDALDQGRPYTLLAPQNAAFENARANWTELGKPENETPLRDFLREHVIGGYLGIREIEGAIERNKGQPVTMRTAGDGTITFSREDDGIVLTSSLGGTARIAGDAVRASNGAAIPIDSTLAELPG